MKPILDTQEVCTTQRAAEILGISVSSVQHLVEAGSIEAWKTQGGHRRIPLASILAYKGQHAGNSATSGAAPRVSASQGSPIILIVEDNPMQRTLYQRHLLDWGMTEQAVFCDNGYQALLEIARRQPEILLIDIMMDGIDGYEVINTIIADPQLRPMHIAVLSALSESDVLARGGLPPGVVFFSKPVNYDELRGYLRAACAQFTRDTR